MTNEQTSANVNKWQNAIFAIIREKFGEVPKDVEDCVYQLKEWSGTEALVGLLPALSTFEDIRDFLSHDIRTYNVLNS